VSDEQKKKSVNDNGDPFWSRILIVTVIVIWIALMAGNWIGHYVIKSGVLGKKTSAYGSEFKEAPPIRTKTWKQPVQATPDKQDSASLESSEDNDPEKNKTKIAEDLLNLAKSSLETLADKDDTEDETKTEEAEKSAEKTQTPLPSPSPAKTAEVKPSPSPSPEKTQSVQVKPSPKPSATQNVSSSPDEMTNRQTSSTSQEKQAVDSTSDNYAVQLGNFERNDYAIELVDKLKAKGYTPTIVKTGDKYRVYMGNYDNRDKARETSEKLKGEGFDSFVISE
jgi:cell division septation protein DedD